MAPDEFATPKSNHLSVFDMLSVVLRLYDIIHQTPSYINQAGRLQAFVLTSTENNYATYNLVLI